MTRTGEGVVTPLTADDELAVEVVALVRRWLVQAAELPVDRSAARLSDMLRDPDGLAFTVAFVDDVIRPEDPAVAARALARLGAQPPAFLPPTLRTALRTGALAGRVAPALVVPVVRRVLRGLVGHLVVDATDARLAKSIRALTRRGDAAAPVRLNVNLLGEAVLGDGEAARRLDGTVRLLARPDVDYVSIKVSATVAPHSPWAFDEAVEDVTRRLAPLYELAAASDPPKFVNLDMEEYHDLDLTVAVFTALLDRPEFAGLGAGIVLQAYLPDSLGALMRLQEWARERRARGGAPIKVRLVKGANLPMEHVEAAVRGWPLATWNTKQDTDTHYKRLLDRAIRPEHVDAVRVGVAGHNLFDVALGRILARRRGVEHAVDFEMLLGMAQNQADVVRRDVGGLLLYTPVVHPGEFDVAISYLVRRLEEGASTDNYMSAAFDLAPSGGPGDDVLFERERDRFLCSLRGLNGGPVPDSHRVQDRRAELPVLAERFANIPDTDPSTPGNRAWAASVLAAARTSERGADLVESSTLDTRADLDTLLDAARATGAAWAAVPNRERADVLRRCSSELQRRRGELAEVMAAECGKTLDQSDPEVSEAADFASYYAECADRLGDVDGARPVPRALTVVTPPWNFPVAIPAGGVLAALAAGSAVILKPAPQAKRCGSLVADALWAAGVPRSVLTLLHVDEAGLGRALVSDPRVDQVILTGAYDTAATFRSLRPDLRLLAETSGKNAIVVAPSADMDLAVRDVVASAFGHAGQKCSAASLVVLVGEAARSRRFRDQLVDATGSLVVGPATDPRSRMGPLIEPPSGTLASVLHREHSRSPETRTVLTGARWLVRPRQLSDDGRLWSPGILDGVRPGSEFHRTEYFGPVLGIMTADDLPAAVDLVNQVEYGLTSGLHTLDAADIAYWVEHVEAGNLYVNRGITGAIVRRQPFGGWKKSSVGPGAKAGGPQYVRALTGWSSAPARAQVEPDEFTRDILAAAPADGLDSGFLSRALASDQVAWRREFGVCRDVSALDVERNVFRYLPVPVTVRACTGTSAASVLRVVAAGVRAGSPVTVSVADPLPRAVADLLSGHAVSVTTEDDGRWRARLRAADGGRVRVLGGDRRTFAHDTGGDVAFALYDGEVTEAGDIEMLPFLREQAVSMTAHRFGTLDRLTEGILDT
ncbi:bifunctional proline dehydrogenase/L-glutamate gamma-semialdehyde dehydrogenase [Rhodococcus sp. HNM0569]|uniref:proline dehydrogenase family protein n=1 Tax=Rhodococcus sp. HNM0569 TaxID=2716340 RepID=UPI00146C3780|nr:bifunctional proline dehydrogenase/L-glutamate gamma-semialdehyde dehydrogenase [Rhodococcus sp. HNM0569]NLU83593.1 bifunctional proline dehydrogenase/L-glutamate gamma-semialdehyde dehydrogenase [Rhodococcus sp. HNM0569]